MNNVARSLIAVGLSLCVGAECGATGQTLLNPAATHKQRVQDGERRVYLEPRQVLESVEVSEGCLTFLTEVRFSISLPFGRAVESVLPAGTSWPLPPGRYRLDNPTQAPVEFLLRTRGACGATSSREDTPPPPSTGRVKLSGEVFSGCDPTPPSAAH
jgi:hypothetical protein